MLSKAWLEERRERVLEWLQRFHAQHPSAPGAPIASARLGFEPEIAAIVFENFAAVRLDGEVISLATHKPAFSAEEAQLLGKIESAFRSGGLQPPTPGEVLKLIPDGKRARELLEVLVKNKKVVRLSDDLIFHADAISQVRNTVTAQRGRRFSVPDFKDWMKISRKYAIPLLEHLDRARVTRREGENRVVL
ncbi:MAG: SelB C-terminal domain-containing protein [Acidobacteriaceae bacterium]|nr:SelB C-terminal domain-containing protein [Acidobacteriaceae bacterium]